MTGNSRHRSLIVVAGLAILLMAFAAPAPAQSTADKADSVIIPASAGPDEEITGENENAEDQAVDDNSLVPKGRHGGAKQTETQQSNSSSSSTSKKNLNNANKVKSSQNTTLQNQSGTSGKKTQTVTRSSAIKPEDLSKISIGNKNASAPISLAEQAKLGTTSIEKQPVSQLTGSSASALTGPGSVAKTGIAATDILKANPGGIKTAPAPGATNTTNNTNTSGNVTGGGKGSVTVGGVSANTGDGSNVQGSTVSTGGGNTVGGIQQSGNNDTVNVTQNNTTNVTKVSGGGGGGGGFGGGGGGGGGEIPSVDVSPIEPEPQPVVVTRVVAAPQDSCPTVVELNQMGFNYYQAGTYNSAEDVFKRALEILDKQLCKDKPLKATTLENLAFTFDKLDRHDEAVKYQEQAQLIRRMR